MKNVLYTILIVSCFYATSQELQLTNIDSSEYFSFWEGTWEGTWDEGEGKVGKATNFIEWTTGGKVLQENFEIYHGQNQGFFGTSISVFNPQTKEWKQAWADNQGGYFDFYGVFEDNRRMFQTHPKEINGTTIIQRMTFYELDTDSFTWDWEGSRDGGETWNLNWRIKYVRK